MRKKRATITKMKRKYQVCTTSLNKLTILIANEESDEELARIRRNEGRVTPDRDEERKFKNPTVNQEPSQMPRDARNPAVEVIGVRDRREVIKS